jgi:acetyl-CoA synthetase
MTFKDAETYEQLIRDFSWHVPEKLNIAHEICERHAIESPNALALVEDTGTCARCYSFADLKRLSDNLAYSLATLGVNRGTRVVFSLGQDAEGLLAHLACFKIGAVSVPIAALYSGEGIAFRVNDSNAHLIITDRAGADKVAPLDIPGVSHIIVTGGMAQGDELGFDALIAQDCGAYPLADTRADEPALIFYTSGSTGQPKGALHGHRMILGHLNCVRLGFEMAPQPDDVFWTASDWSWLGSLGDLVFPALYFGKTLIGTPGRVTAENIYRTLQDHKVTCPFMATAVLRKLSKEPFPQDPRFVIRAIMTGGEAMPPEVFKWAIATFKAPINEEFGLTEANQISVGCATLYQSPAGSVGRIAPGAKIKIVDAFGAEMPSGERGEIVIWFDSPSNMLGYLNRPEQTASKLVDGWFRTGDEGRIDKDNFLYYYGRLDDLIMVNGMRVGPEEVEAELLLHPAVKDAAVVGMPDAGSGEMVTAAITLQEGHVQFDALIQELQALVKRNLAAHCYPKRIVVVDDIPVTSTGKIQRKEMRRNLLALEAAVLVPAPPAATPELTSPA